MLSPNLFDKLTILADAAKYDVSCSSSGVNRKNSGSSGNAVDCGICHTWSADGRCVSLLKILMTNYCIYDCAYCVNRVTNDIKRASLSPEEIVRLTLEFYRRNYIEGLFLSSAIERSPNATMERIVEVLRLLRQREKFGGYIHVKAIPGADPSYIEQAGYYADRMSVNIELATEEGLRRLAPQKKLQTLFLPMAQIKQKIGQTLVDQRQSTKVPAFVPAGQSTQMIIGATQETDQSIIRRSSQLYQHFQLKRVYYSAYVPINKESFLPSLQTGPPLLREHRLYQADWLLRYYHFSAEEIFTETEQNLDQELDPKIVWALRNIHLFPIDIQKASYNQLLRIPGVGPRSAKRIVKQRRYTKISFQQLQKMGVVVKRAKYFLTCDGRYYGDVTLEPERIRRQLRPEQTYQQLSLF